MSSNSSISYKAKIKSKSLDLFLEQDTVEEKADNTPLEKSSPVES